MELASIKVELDRANEENNKQLALVLEALRDENNSNLIDAAKGAIKKTVSTKQDKVKDDLIKKFKLYQEPGYGRHLHQIWKAYVVVLIV